MEIQWSPQKWGTTLRLSYGFADKVVANHIRPQTRTRTAQLEVFGDGRALGQRIAHPTQGWFGWDISVPAGTNTVAITVKSPSTVDAHLCIDATLHGVQK